MEIEGEDTDPGGWVDVVVGMEVKVVMVDMGFIVVVEAMVDMEVAMEERAVVCVISVSMAWSLVRMLHSKSSTQFVSGSAKLSVDDASLTHTPLLPQLRAALRPSARVIAAPSSCHTCNVENNLARPPSLARGMGVKRV